MPPGPFAYAVLLSAQLAIGSAALLARLGLSAGLSAPALSTWRLTVAALLLVVLPRAGAASAHLPRRIMGRLALAGACLALHFTTWFASLETIPVARSTLLVTTSPLFSGIAGTLFLAAPIARRFWLGVCVALAGVVLVVGGPAALSGGGLSGDLYALAGAALMAAYLMLVETLQAPLGTHRVVVWTCSSAAVGLWIALAATGAPGALPHGRDAWLSIVGMAVIPQLCGHTALNWSLRHFPAGVVGAATLLEPVFAAALAWWIYGETLSVPQIAGAAVLLVGVGIALSAPRARSNERVNSASP